MDYSKMFKSRVRVLIFTSSLAVALIFGFSFYFSLLSVESSLASTVPELAGLAERLKSTLMINTLVFAVIIIGSFVALGQLMTNRLFKPLQRVDKGLGALASGTTPSVPEVPGSGPFDALWRSFASACSRIREQEQAEISLLGECVSELARGGDATARLLELIEAKKSRAGGEMTEREKSQDDHSDDPVFMQPA